MGLLGFIRHPRWLILVGILITHCAWAETLLGRVIAISDGDTVTVLDSTNTQFKIRLMGIDAPEKAQPFGDRSKQALSALIFNRLVSVDWKKRDRYGRVVGKILVAALNCDAPECVKSVDANLEQVKAGMAWWYRDYAKEQEPKDRDFYEQAEFQAKMHRAGLWADKNPIPPWDWRHRRFEGD